MEWTAGEQLVLFYFSRDPLSSPQLSRIATTFIFSGLAYFRNLFFFVGQQMAQRDAKQCRERYMNHLDPTVRKGKLTLREWKTLIEAHDKFGNKYAEKVVLS